MIFPVTFLQEDIFAESSQLWKTYVDPNGFIFDYPHSWSGPITWDTPYSSDPNYTISASSSFSLPLSYYDPYSSHFEITYEEIKNPKNTSLEKYVDQKLIELRKEESERGRYFNLLGTDRILLAGIPSYKIEFTNITTFGDEYESFKTTRIFLISKTWEGLTYGFTIDYTTAIMGSIIDSNFISDAIYKTEQAYMKNLQVVKTVISSFRIMNPNEYYRDHPSEIPECSYENPCP